MKKRQKDFLIFFGIFILAILMYSNWLTMHYASDTYNIMNVGYETYATNWSLKDGRLIMYLITMICAKLNVSIEIYVIGTLLGALLISAGCVIKLKNTILKNGESNLKKEILITIASFFTSLIYKFILVPLNIAYLQTIVFILVIAALVQFVEMFLKKSMPSLYNALGVYLPLITTNCAVLGVALTNVQKEYGILTGVVNGIGTSVGFAIAIVIMAGIREKIEYNDISESFQGTPIVLITAALMSIAFFGFSGLI
jgi:electron transport complex protein RnfA